jgi:hypothetical protein
VRRLWQFALILAVLVVLALLPAIAAADVSGEILTPNGSPLWGVDVHILDATGQVVGLSVPPETDAGGVFTMRFNSAPPLFPLTLTYVSGAGACPDAPFTQVTATQTVPADGVTLTPVTLPVREFCRYDNGAATAYVDEAGGRVLSAPGGVANLAPEIPYGARDLTISYNGAVIGDSKPFLDAYGFGSRVRITAPATPGSGTMIASYTVSTKPYTFTLGTLIVTGGPAPPATSAGSDIEVAIDISGSMNGTDPLFLRRDAVRALLGLVGGNDRLGMFGFDDKFEPVFGLQTVTPANTNALAALADQHILNRGDTDYNVAFTQAYTALTAPSVYDPARPKRVIFLTDGGHNVGSYLNAHMQLASNASGRAWPVCVVQLGALLQPEYVVALLQRIASQTGGQLQSVPLSSGLTDAFRRCLSGATSEQTLVDTSVSFARVGRPKTVTRQITGTPGMAKFFVSFTPGGELTPVLTDPSGRKHTPRAPGRNVVFRHSGTFFLYKVTRPQRGRWTVTMTPTRLVRGVVAARVSVSVGRS